MEPLPFPTYLDHLRRESARFREVLTDCDPRARVPACPDWDAADLLWHLTTVQAFWAEVVTTRPAPVTEDDVDRLSRPESYGELLTAFDEHSAALLAALASAGPGEQAWHWSSDQTVGASYRRQAHEALIHRLDAEETAGPVTDLDPTLAADGVLEALTVMYGGCPPWGTITPSDRVVGLRLTDTGDVLHVALARFTGTDPDDGKAYDEPDVAVVPHVDAPLATISGTAGDLDAWLWHRGVGRVDVRLEGDESVLSELRAILSHPIN
ncbi:maleylpyruvate isomerase family mycothiol-dependent enzyme [Nocardioides sp.]|uniref:maleylpyruvate isomerase family mycothiol-dependent enzyme n=1 Tax=Nocardioides sp. TaxID=35761 RepID=UPI001A24C43D|nr:maleylpyruvate isomerase family mycothiol-dependent enzyme [Nocardioides sp.]MBJ7357453.1 maleylpyruvate isomerase family mycothiol-dependent enzyme [Nocardioides sp.]